PTSPFTGGALLGDRVRMQELSGKGDVFIRSMATRGSGGGLAASTREISMVLDAFGCDIIIIETVGVGQIELDIAGVCDSVVVVLVPESGDGVQTLKAGLMEIADIFAVNKADRMGSARLIAEIRTMLNIRGNRNGWNLPVIKTEAINNVGIEDLEAGLNKHYEFLQHGSQKQDHQRSKKIRELKNIVREKLFASLLPELLDKSTVDYYINKILNGETDPYTVVEEIFKRIELKDKNIL
ncbi:MAG: methylmalonyl Co-A mutase-associated GTPase MeaB, partial [candidate division Zixibacteria bacterium]|nr:methylmalonyl Co-A mutase-associated GTPase MeaB [candidate division Zixibacteria bacterium]